jgi:hypothetical protein
VVVVAGDGDDRDAVAGQAHQRAVDQLLRRRRRCRGVVEVARDEHGVDLVGPRDRHDLAEHRLLLVEAGATLEGLADVPVGGVQEAHRAAIVGATPDTLGEDGRGRRATA